MLVGKKMVFTVTTFTTEIRIVHMFKKTLVSSVEKGFVGRSPGLGKNNQKNAGNLYA